MARIDGTKLRRVEVMNQAVPTENPKAIPIVLDFSADPTQTLDMSLEVWQGQIQMVQTIYIDCQGAFGLTVIINDGFQNVVCKPNSQGYFNLLCPNPIKFTFLSTQDNTNQIQIFLINVPIAGHSWSTV